MSDKKSESEVVYEVEDAKPKSRKNFLKSRGAKVTGITVGAAIALVGSFGLGVIAGEKIAGNGPASMSQGEHFGPGMGFPKAFGDDDHRGPGGPEGDNDHGQFQMPNTVPTPLTTP
jgi:hypothetical protein